MVLVLPPAQTTQPRAARLLGTSILLDPGHSDAHHGAVGQPPDHPREWDLNLLQAEWIQARLRSFGCEPVIAPADIEDLDEIGAMARGHDAFVSCHHNAFDHVDHHTFACVDSHTGSGGSIALAAEIAGRVARALRLPLRRQTGLPDGVVRQGLAVLRAAELTGCRACVLVESYFLDAYGDARLCRGRSLTAADAIADGVLAWLTRA